MKTGKYILSIILSVLLFVVPAGCFIWVAVSRSVASIVVAVIITICAALLYHPIETMRIAARRDAEYDEFGLSKTKGRYEKLSKKERDQIDLQKTAHAEIVLDSTAVKKMIKHGSDDPDNDLDNLIGLVNVKDKVRTLAARMKFEYEEQHDKVRRKELKGKSHGSLSGRHMVFYGPPGTGKTTVARIMTGYLYKYGFIKQNKCVEIDGNFLKAGEDTAMKTTLLIRQAFDGVLFIDEAYALMSGTHGEEAIATLIKHMEDDKKRFVLIVAGYTDEMKRLLKSNPGFLSRIKESLFFKDYTNAELFEIFQLMAHTRGFVVGDCQSNFDIRMQKERTLYSFGNARTVRNVLEETIDRHSLNVNEGKTPEDQKYILSAQDVSFLLPESIG